ncbi:GNAT family N-acetyltransferase, partial [Klebsiella pneumoniae]|uniref:GNAT family N-acetyltransferase n=1 Tax=Klebsiella pneumoniae TaxID=573 RepID=UPI003788559D
GSAILGCVGCLVGHLFMFLVGGKTPDQSVHLNLTTTVQGQGWGEMLVAHVMRVVWGASKAVGIYGLFVEALNEKAKAFYLRLGFIQLVDENSNLLFYPTKSIEQLFTDDES